ncbi:CLUMA_CG016879, isoform A [Clunio marinus]|uniref:CLUMA_CG016879, isoform A n=1 Tax=Clunio marinus TaxID=568069 RepID=A0A1J1IYB6_9DIPT|nr:CLUMA_CG016879, isoform A [Clunio marinus]
MAIVKDISKTNMIPPASHLCVHLLLNNFCCCFFAIVDAVKRHEIFMYARSENEIVRFPLNVFKGMNEGVRKNLSQQAVNETRV